MKRATKSPNVHAKKVRIERNPPLGPHHSPPPKWGGLGGTVTSLIVPQGMRGAVIRCDIGLERRVARSCPPPIERAPSSVDANVGRWIRAGTDAAARALGTSSGYEEGRVPSDYPQEEETPDEPWKTADKQCREHVVTT